ncbi:hypothetical protein CLOLEP_00492 [[Clostridium] leptum DSM 753]|uniref:Uncharacterized protein n=1 Tax=[Clostridium] leptum DSM 753 TaxID=428125 RepID=A7VPL6_9FIRM|nr:hypothetical protein CLOLEP_00492 [[Clostridium] leptum DSM 753]
MKGLPSAGRQAFSLCGEKTIAGFLSVGRRTYQWRRGVK